MLNEAELWQKVKNLQGEIVDTLIQKKPNKILCVTDNDVVIEERKSKPSRTEIFSLYKQTHETREVYNGDARQFTWAVTYAILVKAVPDEIEAIPGGALGIKLRER